MSGPSDVVETPQGAAAVSRGAPARVGRFRWIICALLFFATTINYLDRQVLGILAAPLQKELGWSESEYGWIATAFTGAYAAGLLVVGGLMDRLGTRIGFSLAVVCWSLAAMGHALARSALGFGVARFALGLSESGNFPAAIKTVAEWFPKTERALATGIFNSGSNVGAIVAPLVVPWIATRYGWRWAFVITGATGFAWLAAWLAIYRKPEEHPRLSRAELAHIRSDPVEPTVTIPWAQPAAPPADVGLRRRQVLHRPDLVVLPLLAAEVPQPDVRHHPERPRPAARRHLPRRGHRQHRRRLDLLDA